ncbi:MAG: hypothetical protein NDI82_04395 [Anaeromyxobacteraceae bacterium]|nr:hypothetical protein [Anaeromyxobacteraceae bacterium]
MLTGALGLVPTLLLAAHPWPPLTKAELEDGISACMEEKTVAIERLATQHAECTEDADCVAIAQSWLGCAGWRSLRMPSPAGLSARLYEACIGLPALGKDCSGNVGACVSGKCAARARSGVGCAAATAALLRRADELTACKRDGDCEVEWIAGTRMAVSARFTVEGARAIHAQEDACEDGARGHGAPEGAVASKAACVDDRCRLVPAPPPVLTKPRMRDASCLSDRLQALLGEVPVRGRATLKFLVGSDGRTGAFQFVGPSPIGLREPLIWTVLGCEWEPGTQDGKAMAAWVVLPLVLK